VHRLLLVTLLTLITVGLDTAGWAAETARAQGGRGGGRGGGPAVVSPDVSADGRITLRLLAPDASEVTVSGELDGRSYELTKGENGVWSVTIGPLPPDIYTYTFVVDGLRILDPRNANTKYGYGGFGATSIVEVPADGPAFYDVRDVPHGEVRVLPYVSTTMGVGRTVWVYTPPGYEDGGDFPVLYLMHGGGDIESGWTMIGRANNILDNAIADGRAVPMVVVMPLGHEIQSFWAGPARSSPNASGRGGRGGGGGAQELSLFGRELVNELIPMIEARYRVSRQPQHRAIGGLSMGGGQTINVAFNRPELFRYVVLMSPLAGSSTPEAYPDFFGDAAAANQRFDVLWLGVGEDDTLTGPGDRALHEAFVEHGIEHTWVLSPGRHEWTVWRHYLRDVLPLLFKQ